MSNKEKKNQNEIMQKKPVHYIATVSAQGKEITDDSNLLL